MAAPTPTRRRARMALAGIATTAGLAVAGVGGLTLSVALADPAPAVVESAIPAEHPTPLADALDNLVADGTLTQEQADAVMAETRAEVESLPAVQTAREKASEFAALLGTDVETLIERLKAGDTIGDVATSNGVDLQVVIDDLNGRVSARLDQAVSAGYLSPERAAELEARASEAIDKIVREGLPRPPAGWRPGDGPFGR